VAQSGPTGGATRAMAPPDSYDGGTMSGSSSRRHRRLGGQPGAGHPASRRPPARAGSPC
jgi:hypothetical protein